MTSKEPYTFIAEAYDYMLRHVDYQQWYLFISGIMLDYINNPRTVLELGCGTGKFGAKFSAEDFEIYGIDKSLNMLRVSKTRAFRNFRIICSDIVNFHLNKKFDFIFSVHDTMNYQIHDDEVRQVLRNVKDVMHDESIFMFDITTEHNIDRFFDNKTSFYKTRGYKIEWGNRYDREKRHVVSSFTIDRKGVKTEEEHVQKIYTIDEMITFLAMEGFEVLHICSDYSYDPPSDETVMVNFITRKRKYQ